MIIKGLQAVGPRSIRVKQYSCNNAIQGCIVGGHRRQRYDLLAEMMHLKMGFWSKVAVGRNFLAGQDFRPEQIRFVGLDSEENDSVLESSRHQSRDGSTSGGLDNRYLGDIF